MIKKMLVSVNSTSKQNENQKNIKKRVESDGASYRVEHGALHGDDRILAPR